MARLTGIVDGAEPDVRVVRISGDPWSGKSQLLTALAEHARSRGWTVARGAAGPLPGSLPFGVFSDALDDLLMSRHPALLDGFPRYHVSWLAGIYPALAQYSPDAAMPTNASEMRHVFHAVRALLERLTADAPLLLVIDDLQWADPASVDLFAHLVRHAPDAPVLLATALRPRQTAGDLLAMLDETSAGDCAAHIGLAPLPDDYLGTLLRADLPADRRHALLDGAGGNPGLLRALAAAESLDRPAGDGSSGSGGGSASGSGASDGGASGVSGCGTAGPGAGDSTGPGPNGYGRSGMPVSVLREFRTLSPFAWTVAHAAALVREPFDTGLLEAVVEGDQARTRAAVDELVGNDILRVDGGERTFRFRNALLRATAHRAAGAAWRLGAHARAAQALREREAPAPEIAHHLQHCVRVEEDDAAAILVDAAREVLWERPRDAAAWLRRALDRRGPVCPDHVPLLATALVVIGHTTDASALFGQVTPCTETAPWAARALHVEGRREAAGELLRAALRAAGPDDHRGRARLAAALLVASVDAHHPTEVPDPSVLGSVAELPGAACLSVLADHLDPVADAGTRALLLSLVALTAPTHIAGPGSGAGGAGGGRDGAEDGLPQARALVAAVSDAELAPDLAALYWLARAEHALGHDHQARRHLDRALSVATRFGHHYVLDSIAALIEDLGAEHHPADDLPRIPKAAPQEAPRGGPDADPVNPATDATDATDTTGTDAADPADLPSELAQLSRREREISRLVSDGRTNQQIARTLGLSHKTVETYLARIFKKLELCSRAQLATIVGRSVSAPTAVPAPTPPAAVPAAVLPRAVAPPARLPAERPLPSRHPVRSETRSRVPPPRASGRSTPTHPGNAVTSPFREKSPGICGSIRFSAMDFDE